MTASPQGRPVRYEDTDYYFCCAGCRRSFQEDPAAYLKESHASHQ